MVCCGQGSVSAARSLITFLAILLGKEVVMRILLLKPADKFGNLAPGILLVHLSLISVRIVKHPFHKNNVFLVVFRNFWDMAHKIAIILPV